MGKIICLGSGSSGNCYILETEKECLLLDLGVNFKDVVRSVGFDVSKIKGALVTHIHQDHAKYINECLSYMIDVYSCSEVCKKYDKSIYVQPRKRFCVGGFKILPLDVKHNSECYAYLIDNDDFGRLLFLTDAMEFNYNIKGVNHFIIEANYSDDILLDKYIQEERVLSRNNNHLEIRETIDILKRNYTIDTNTITLCHLSDGQSDKKRFVEMVSKEIGLKPLVAEKGVVIEINKSLF